MAGSQKKWIKDLKLAIKGYTNRNFTIQPNTSGTRLIIKINGCDIPFYTNAHPSNDSRAKLNFISDIRRHFKQLGIDPNANTVIDPSSALAQALQAIPETKPVEPVVELTDEELELLTAPTTTTETQEEETEPMKTTQESNDVLITETSLSSAISLFMTKPRDERIKLLVEVLDVENLAQLVLDVTEAKAEKKQNAIVSIATAIEESGVSLDDIAALLEQNAPATTVVEPETTTPTKLTKSAIRKGAKVWIEKTLKDNPTKAAVWFHTHWDNSGLLCEVPPYNTIWNWVDAVKKELGI